MAPLFFPAASSPTPPSPGPRARSWSLKPGLEGGERRSLSRAQHSAGPAQAAPPPALRAGWLALSGRRRAFPKAAYSPCPISQPRAPELAATSSGRPPRSADEPRRHRSERGSEPEPETGGGGRGPSRNFPPTRFRVFGVRLGEPNGKETPIQRVPIPIARASLREAGRAVAEQVGRGKEGTCPARTSGEDPGCRGSTERKLAERGLQLTLHVVRPSPSWAVCFVLFFLPPT